MKRNKTVGRNAPYASELLIAALENQAIARRHSASQLALSLGVHPAHWYRLRAAPALLARCERRTMEGIATYLGWSLGRVLLACGVIDHSDFEVILGGPDIVTKTMEAVEQGPYGAGLLTPLSHAKRDHQILIAELFTKAHANELEMLRYQGPILDQSTP